MYKIMIAEDEPIINEGIKKMIEAFAPEYAVCICAYDGEEALQWIEKEKFDVVFTDIRMPVIDGLELLKYIDENQPDVITVVISGYEIFDYAQKALKYHVFEYLLKPVSVDGMKELLNRIRSKIREKEEIQKEKFYHRTFSSEGTSEKMDEPYSYRMFLLNAGSLGHEENKDEKQDKTVKDRVEEVMSAMLVNTHGERWFWFPGRTASEYVVIEEKNKSNSYIGNVQNNETEVLGKMSNLYEALIKEKFPVTVVESEEIFGMNELYEKYRKLHYKLVERLVFGHSLYFFEASDVKHKDITLSIEEKDDFFL